MQANEASIKLEKVIEKHGKDKIHNVLVDYLDNHKIKFLVKDEPLKNAFFTKLKDVIWLIDFHKTKFSKLPNCPRLPVDFFKQNYRALSHDGKVKKNDPPNLKREQLYSAAIQLDNLLNMKKSKVDAEWKRAVNDIRTFKNALDFYNDYYLALANDKNKSVESDSFDSVQRIEGNLLLTPLHHSTYYKLQLELEKHSEYTPIFVYDFSPIQNRCRYNYIRKMQFKFPTQLLRIASPPRSYYVWKIPEELQSSHDSNIASLTKNLLSAKNVSEIKKRKKNIINKSFANTLDYNKKDIEALKDLVTEGKC